MEEQEDWLVQEVIVVEGRDDVRAVRRAVQGEVLAVNGFGVSRPQTLASIKQAHERVGVIVLTDPDSAGEHIRRTIEAHVPDVKHAFLPREEGTRASDGNVGIEHANATSIRRALSQARRKQPNQPAIFTMHDLIALGLSGHPAANERRQRVGTHLGIGVTNAKQFLRRLNHFGVTKEELADALGTLEESPPET